MLLKTMYLENLQLYYSSICPYCVKVRIAMKIMGVELESKNIHSELSFKNELIEGGGKKQVPCLRIQEDHNVRWLYESSDIVAYLRKTRDQIILN